MRLIKLANITRSIQYANIRNLPFLCCVILCLFAFVSGCHRSAVKTSSALAALPARHSVRSDQLLVLSDFKIERNHPLIQNLKSLRSTVIKSLNLSSENKEVVVYLFKDKLAYEKYLNFMYPELPSRRAYFVGSPKELAVFTYMGDRVQEDLRHEFTHGLLHANSSKVPLWLDEGIAEYFETTEEKPGMLKSKYTQKLSFALSEGWTPDIKRLEELDDFATMNRDDYQEAWAWVHFMIHHSPETHSVLREYLEDLKKDAHPKPISKRLKTVIPRYHERVSAYMANMNTMTISQAGNIPQSGYIEQAGYVEESEEDQIIITDEE